VNGRRLAVAADGVVLKEHFAQDFEAFNSKPIPINFSSANVVRRRRNFIVDFVLIFSTFCCF